MIALRKLFLVAGALAACLCLPRAAPSAEALSEEEKHDLYSQAKDLFRQANQSAASDPAKAKDLYRQGAMRFERLAGGGVRSGRLYYNTGNAYFRMGDLGRAILNYRRAERYIPGDQNLAQNLDYARSRRRDRIEEPQRARVLKTVFFWHYDLSPGARSVVFACCFAAFWLGASIRLFRRGAVPQGALAFLGLVAALFLGSLLAETFAQAHDQPGVILAEETIARKGDGESFEPAFKEPLHAGTEFNLIEGRRDWLQIELPDGQRCWVRERDVGLVAAVATKPARY